MNEKKDLQTATAAQPQVPSLYSQVWAKFGKSTIQALQASVMPKNSSLEQTMLYLMQCSRLDLDPFQGHCYAAEIRGAVRIVVGYQGRMQVCSRDPKFRGYTERWEVVEGGKITETRSGLIARRPVKEILDGGDVICSVQILKDGLQFPPFEATLSEFYRANSEAWQQHWPVMLFAKAFGHAAKRAYPSLAIAVDDDLDGVEGARVRKDITAVVEVQGGTPIEDEEGLAAAIEAERRQTVREQARMRAVLATAATAPAKAESAHATTAEVATKIRDFFGNSASSAAAIAKKLPPIYKADLASISQDELSALIEDATAPVLNPVAADELFGVGGGDDNK